MKSCIYCGNPLEDQAQFCNVCGQKQYQTQQPQPTYGQDPWQAPQYQQPQYQMPQQPFYPNPAKPVKPPVNTIGLFTCLAAVAVSLLSIVVNIIVPVLGIKLYEPPLNMIYTIVLHVVYIGIAMIGFAAYNGAVQPQLKLSVLWVGIPWGIRFIIIRLSSLLLSALKNFMLMEMGMSAYVYYSLVSLILQMIILAVSIAITWILTCVILKAIVKNRMK